MDQPFKYEFTEQETNVLYAGLRKAPMPLETTEPVILKLRSQYMTQVEARKQDETVAAGTSNRRARRSKKAAARRRGNGADEVAAP